MESRTRLDCALFQLTPTRTRCDLVLFCGGKTEKLASGLFEPFISHLRFAKDEISKGGYSIELCPPTTDAPWFTKATFERFVRFVSTPGILERFVGLEREILQIESSVQANELSNTNVAVQLEEGSGLAAKGTRRKSTDYSKLIAELERIDDVVLEENSKVQLQRLLETRKALLRKEQAMAYARGLVAGFEVDNIDDLISFGDAFGAWRLREACTKFKELCKKKHTDGLWMEELAAMEACFPSELSFMGTSGIVLTNDISAPNQNIMLNFPRSGISTGDLALNGSSDASKSDSTASHASSDSKKDGSLPASDQIPSTTTRVQVPMPWPNQMPQYMYNFQGPIQQLPPYQGYRFSPMQPVPPHYPRNMQWPRNQKSSSEKKENFFNRKALQYSGEDKQIESSDSDSGSDSASYVQQERKHSTMENSYRKKPKKSSRTVVIRNINYITPKGRNGEMNGVSDGTSSDEDEFIDEDSLKQKVDDSVESLEKSHKSKSSYNKKRGADKSHRVANRSNDDIDQDFDADLVANASEGGKRNENWDAFQNLLMTDEEVTVNAVERLQSMDVRDVHFIVKSSDNGIAFATSPAVDVESEKFPKQLMVAGDSFVITERNGRSEGRVEFRDFENGENVLRVSKGRDCADENLFNSRLKESGSELGGISSACAAEPSIIKGGKGEDWFIVNHSRKPENRDSTTVRKIFTGDCILTLEGDSYQTEKSTKNVFVDDSIMVQARASDDDLYNSQWKTDISMVVDQTSVSQTENGTKDASQNKHKVLEACEPVDLYMKLERDSGIDSAKVSWTMDYGIDMSLTEVDRKCSEVETSDHVDKKLPTNCKRTVVKNNKFSGTKNSGKEARPKVLHGSPARSKTEIISKSKKPSFVSRPTVQKSKLEKEEETRKKMEESLIQRQKRIAERTAASGFAQLASKKVPPESKSSIKCDRNRAHSITRTVNISAT